ncbi:MAG: hypothetical protein J6023_05760, partial [Clostridia bacterium]|nr:hypothetical protein [Clostridia bacterium]
MLIAVCFVLFISTILNVGKGMTFVYVLLALNIVGTAFGWIKVRLNDRLTDRLFEMDKKQEKLEELKKQYTNSTGNLRKVDRLRSSEKTQDRETGLSCRLTLRPV